MKKKLKNAWAWIQALDRKDKVIGSIALGLVVLGIVLLILSVFLSSSKPARQTTSAPAASIAGTSANQDFLALYKQQTKALDDGLKQMKANEDETRQALNKHALQLKALAEQAKALAKAQEFDPKDRKELMDQLQSLQKTLKALPVPLLSEKVSVLEKKVDAIEKEAANPPPPAPAVTPTPPSSASQVTQAGSGCNIPGTSFVRQLDDCFIVAANFKK